MTFNAAGLGLANLASGTDFIDNAATNKVIVNLSAASTLLRTQASALGSNLSIVQIRQDFSKNLINVLQTGSSNLTLADTNEEAANSQALSTRQSIAVSALALANQSSRACSSCSAKRERNQRSRRRGKPRRHHRSKSLKTIIWRHIRRAFARTMFRKRREPPRSHALRTGDDCAATC